MSGDYIEVHKFGGTSVSKLSDLLQLVQLIRAPRKVIVVSAFSTVTDLLIKCIEDGVNGLQEDMEQKIAHLEKIHFDVIQNSPSSEAARPTVQRLLDEVRNKIRGVFLLRECSPKARDSIIAFGELLSAPIVSAALQAEFVDSRDVISTDDTYGNATVDFVETERLCAVRGLGSKPIAVVTGFIGRSKTGATTTLGRSGSDYTATILGGSLRSRLVVIWTDVNGVLSCDPRLVPGAFTLPKISYREAAEMAFFGSKVLFSKMMTPCEKLHIPIEVRRTTLDTDAPFTLIGSESTLVAAVSCVRHVSVVIVSGPGMKGYVGLAASVFTALAQHKVSAIMIAQASSEQELCVVIESADAERAVRALNQHFVNEVKLGIIHEMRALHDRFSVVNVILGKGMQSPGVAARLFHAAAAVGVNIKAIAQPASELSISCVVLERDAGKCMKAFHDAFAGAPHRSQVVLLGQTGGVGSAVANIIAQNKDKWRHDLETSVVVVATANSKEKTILGQTLPADTSMTQFIQQLHERLGGHLTYVDCTASEEVASIYPEVLALGNFVVAANKKAFAGSVDLYAALSKYRHTHLHYSAAFMAGSGRVLNTLTQMQRSGDRIVRASGVFSGTLSFVFNQMASSHVSFSEAVRDAKSRGYTEPDPRDDLSGADFARKLVLLARAIGHTKVTFADVKWHSEPLVSDALASLTLEQFMQEGLAALDKQLTPRLQQAEKEGKKIVFTGVVDEAGHVSMGLESVTLDSPLAALRGAANMVVVKSVVLGDAALVIQASGAGNVVTAQAVVSDILQCALTNGF